MVRPVSRLIVPRPRSTARVRAPFRVDDGHYALKRNGRVQISEVIFRYRVVNERELFLTPH